MKRSDVPTAGKRVPPNRESGACTRVTAWLPKEQARKLKAALAIEGVTIQEWMEREAAAKIKAARAAG